MNFISLKSVVWFVVNLIGIFAFMMVAMQTWIEPELRDIPGASGGAPILWVLVALPIALLFALLHIGMGILIYLKKRTNSGWDFKTIMVTITFWVVAITIDHAHH